MTRRACILFAACTVLLTGLVTNSDFLMGAIQ